VEEICYPNPILTYLRPTSIFSSILPTFLPISPPYPIFCPILIPLTRFIPVFTPTHYFLRSSKPFRLNFTPTFSRDPSNLFVPVLPPTFARNTPTFARDPPIPIPLFSQFPSPNPLLPRHVFYPPFSSFLTRFSPDFIPCDTFFYPQPFLEIPTTFSPDPPILPQPFSQDP